MTPRSNNKVEYIDVPMLQAERRALLGKQIVPIHDYGPEMLTYAVTLGILLTALLLVWVMW